MTGRRTVAIGIVLLLAIVPVAAAADNHLEAGVTVTQEDCGGVTFDATITGGTPPYNLDWSFGDGETSFEPGIPGPDAQALHTYTEAGDYTWELIVTDDAAGEVSISEMLSVGPSVELTSTPFPPLVSLENGEASVDFTATVTGGKGTLLYEWDFDGGGTDSTDPGSTSFIYTGAGKYEATVSVTDECGLTAVDKLPVVVIDPEAEACHPTAQKIADAVSMLFPLQALDLYTCEDIFGIFRGDLTGYQLGFGRLWHAYKLTETIQEMTWEEIRDWHLDGNGWGGLLQLNRFADLLEEYSIGDLVDLVMSGEASIREVRHSIRAVTRYEANFEDALAMLGDGMSPGELGRFYRTGEELGLGPEELEAYLTDGFSLQELAHAARMAASSGADWAEIAEAHAAGNSWGEIKQAQRLAEDGEWNSILETGIQDARQQSREDDKTEREGERVDRTAEQLASAFGASVDEILELYNGECAQDWSCVRKALRNPEESNAASGSDQKTAARLANQYGVEEAQVWTLFNGTCSGDWSCVRAELRGEAGRGGGRKPKD